MLPIPPDGSPVITGASPEIHYFKAPLSGIYRSIAVAIANTDFPPDIGSVDLFQGESYNITTLSPIGSATGLGYLQATQINLGNGIFLRQGERIVCSITLPNTVAALLTGDEQIQLWANVDKEAEGYGK